MIKQTQLWTIVTFIWILSACATKSQDSQYSQTHKILEKIVVNENKTELDFVSKLIKISELDTLSPTEKFNIYFSGNIRKFPDPETTKLILFEGFSDLYTITIIGSIQEGVKQTAKFIVPRDSVCISPNQIIQKLPMLEKSPKYGPAIIREDDPTKWEFYAAYSIHNDYGYVSYDFANDACLREIGITQKIR